MTPKIGGFACPQDFPQGINKVIIIKSVIIRLCNIFTIKNIMYRLCFNRS